jgi:hypothetical protein
MHDHVYRVPIRFNKQFVITLSTPSTPGVGIGKPLRLEINHVICPFPAAWVLGSVYA